MTCPSIQWVGFNINIKNNTMSSHANDYTAHLERERRRLDQEACRLRSGSLSLDSVCWQEHLEQTRRHLERENQSLRQSLSETRTHCYQTSGNWKQYQSWVSSAGDMYWYHTGNGRKVWDDWSPVEGEPDWWTWDQDHYELTQYFRTHNPDRLGEVDGLLTDWCDDIPGLWDKLDQTECYRSCICGDDLCGGDDDGDEGYFATGYDSEESEGCGGDGQYDGPTYDASEEVMGGGNW
jgi:hypothetical protein